MARPQGSQNRRSYPKDHRPIPGRPRNPPDEELTEEQDQPQFALGADGEVYRFGILGWVKVTAWLKPTPHERIKAASKLARRQTYLPKFLQWRFGVDYLLRQE